MIKDWKTSLVFGESENIKEEVLSTEMNEKYFEIRNLKEKITNLLNENQNLKEIMKNKFNLNIKFQINKISN